MSGSTRRRRRRSGHRGREKESVSPRATETGEAAEIPEGHVELTVHVASARNLRSPHASSRKKDKSLVTFSRFFFFGDDNTRPEDSTPVEGADEVEYAHTRAAQFPISTELAAWAAIQPFRVYIVEKEKKHQTVLGHVDVDLMPLLQGESHIEGIFPIEWDVEFPPEGAPDLDGSAAPDLDFSTRTDAMESEDGEHSALAVVEIHIDCSTPIMTMAEFDQTRILDMGVDAMFSPPERWLLQEDDDHPREKAEESNLFRYELRTVLSSAPPGGEEPPAAAEGEGADAPAATPNASAEEQALVFPDGELRFAPLPEAGAGPGGNQDGEGGSGRGEAASGDGVRRSVSSISALDGKEGRVVADLPALPRLDTSRPPGVLLPADQARYDEAVRRVEAEESGQRVVWGSARRVFLPAGTVASLTAAVQAGLPLVLVVGRALRPKYEHVNDPNAEKYRGAAYFDLSPFAVPGTSTVVARTKIERMPGTEEEEVPDNQGGEGGEGAAAGGDATEAANGASGGRRGAGSESGPNTPRSRRQRRHAAAAGGGDDDGTSGSERRSRRRRGGASGAGDDETGNRMRRSASRAGVSGSSKSKAGGSGGSGGAGGQGGSSGTSRRRRKEKQVIEAEPPEAGNPYEKARSYVVVSLVFDRALIPRPPTPKPVLRVSDFIPPRQELPSPPKPLLSAPEEFKGQVEQVVSVLMEEFKASYGAQIARGGSLSQDPAARKERQEQFVFELNSTGQYFLFKEKLKAAVVRIVREKFQKSSPFASKGEMQTFLNDLYMYLIERMHDTINHVFNQSHEINIPTTINDADTLKRYALEAEVNLDFQAAGRHYQERVARDQSKVDFWFDWATFSLRTNNVGRAEECLTEALSRNDAHVPSLTLYGALCMARTKLEEAETILTKAVEDGPDDINAWLVLSLLYELNDQEEEEAAAIEQASALYAKRVAAYETAVAEARAQEDADAAAAAAAAAAGGGKGKKAGPLRTERQERERPLPEGIIAPHSLFIGVTEWLLDSGLAALSEPFLSKDLASKGEASVEASLCVARQSMLRDDYSLADEFLKEVITAATAPDAQEGVTVSRKDLVTAHVLTGHVRFMNADVAAARTSYLEALKISGEDTLYIPDLMAVYLRLGAVHLALREYAEAKETYLKACQHSPSAFTWQGVGVACYRQDAYDEAEDAFSEANILNNLDADVWGYLTLVLLAKGRLVEADQTITQALKCGLGNPGLLREIGAAYASRDRFPDAEQCLQRSAERQPDAHTFRLLGEVQAQLGQSAEATDSFKRVFAKGSDKDRLSAALALSDILGGSDPGAAAEYAAMAEELIDAGVETEDPLGADGGD